jgi:hypothetical protein
MPYSKALKTTPISPHFVSGLITRKPGKSLRPLGDPVASPKQYPSFIAPPPTNLVNLNLSMDVILPEEARLYKK